jgi:putative DNA primase/helicase
MFLINGNNLALLDDMCRRVVVAMIDPQTEHPENRKFDFNPLDRVRQDRGQYVAACLTILLAYRDAGMPAQADPLGSYETWSRWVRDALLWLGEADPCQTILASKANDPVAERIGAVFHHWADVIGEGVRVTVKEIIAKAVEAGAGVEVLTGARDEKVSKPGLVDALHAVAAPMVRGSANERVDADRLGKWLGRHKNRIVGGRRIMPVPELRHGTRQWCLETAGSSEDWACP